MGANVAKLIVDEWAQEGRGKRPNRRFDEAPKGGETLYPETIKSYLKMQYEGIWNQNLASNQEEEEKSEEKSEAKSEEKSEEESGEKSDEKSGEKSDEKSEEKSDEKSEENSEKLEESESISVESF